MKQTLIMKITKIIEKDDLLRADIYVTEILDTYSRSQVKKLFTEGKITINGEIIKPSYKLKEGDVIEIIDDTKPFIIEPVNLNLEILYEDDEVLVVNKPKGLNVHPSISNHEISLVSFLLYHTKNLSYKGGMDRPGIVHRIDKDTSGLLVVAKTDFAYDHLVNQFKNRKTKRIYQTICYNPFSENSGTINAPITRDPNNRTKMAVNPEGKQATTHFKVIKQSDKFSYLECQLETGRTHQIRVHMAYIGHPLVGDTTYGPKKNPIVKDGQALHARLIGFYHPITNQFLEFEVDPTESFFNTLTLLDLN